MSTTATTAAPTPAPDRALVPIQGRAAIHDLTGEMIALQAERIRWLRQKEIETGNPLHEISLSLRTLEHYLERAERLAVSAPYAPLGGSAFEGLLAAYGGDSDFEGVDDGASDEPVDVSPSGDDMRRIVETFRLRERPAPPDADRLALPPLSSPRLAVASHRRDRPKKKRK